MDIMERIREDLDGTCCTVCGKVMYTGYKKAATSMHTIKRNTATAKTKISKRVYYSKECSINGFPVFHLTSNFKK